jgi:hypothetical protein
MKRLTKECAVLAALLGLLWVVAALPVLAGIEDYEFQLVHRALPAVMARKLVDAIP